MGYIQQIISLLGTTHCSKAINGFVMKHLMSSDCKCKLILKLDILQQRSQANVTSSRLVVLSYFWTLKTLKIMNLKFAATERGGGVYTVVDSITAFLSTWLVEWWFNKNSHIVWVPWIWSLCEKKKWGRLLHGLFLLACCHHSVPCLDSCISL